MREPCSALVLIAVALLSVVAATGKTVAQAPDTAAHAPSSERFTHVTTTLYPGWNLVGWLGGEATLGEIRESAGVESVAAWSHVGQRYVSSLIDPGFYVAASGTAVWIRLSDNAAVQHWTRSATLLRGEIRLRAGINLAAWAGEAEDARTAFGAIGGLDAAWRYDARRQQWVPYHPRVFGGDTDSSLQTGDGVLIVASRPTRWVQLVEPGPRFRFIDDVPAALQEAFTSEGRNVTRWLGQQFGFSVPQVEIAVATERGVLNELYSEPIPFWACASSPAYSPAFIVANETCKCGDRAGARVQTIGQVLNATFHGHDILNVAGEPYWIPGSFERRIRIAYDDATTPDLNALKAARDSARLTATQIPIDLAGLSRYTTGSAPEDTDHYYEVLGGSSIHRTLGYLAADYLAERVGIAALFEYLQDLLARPSSVSWQSAFENAFNVTVDDFFRGFETYRADVDAVPDDGGSARVVIVGDINAADVVRIRRWIDEIETYYAEQRGFAAGETRWVVEPTSPSGPCTGGSSINIYAVCVDRYSTYVHEYVHSIQMRRSGGYYLSSAPVWLIEGHAVHETAKYIDRSETGHYAATRSGWVNGMSQTAKALADFGAYDDVGAYPAGALAMEWLTHRAGASSAFEFWTNLPEFETWEAAFAATFGLSADEFFAEYAMWRAAGFPVLE